MKRRFLGHTHMSAIGLCPMCGEAYPKEDGPVCRGCQGEAPYVTASRVREGAADAVCLSRRRSGQNSGP